jgi:hypothetical protein
MRKKKNNIFEEIKIYSAQKFRAIRPIPPFRRVPDRFDADERRRCRMLVSSSVAGRNWISGFSSISSESTGNGNAINQY